MTGSLPADHVAREEALDPARSFIVEAPAGSGKTELLTRRFLRLLAHVKAPEDILAITFTRKAAAEMRGRILKALSLAGGPMPEDSLKQAVWKLAKEALAADQRQNWQLLTHPARLKIMTIDAFNSSLARQLPILSGAGAPLPIARDARSLYAEVTERLIERLGGRDDDADAIASLMRHLDNRYDEFESLLARELERREYWLDLGLLRFDVSTLRERLEFALNQIVARELRALNDSLPRDAHREIAELVAHAAAMLNSFGVESPIGTCDSLKELPEAIGSMLPQWRGIAELLLTKEGEWRARITKTLGFPPEQAAMKQRLESLLKRLRDNEELAVSLHLTRQLPACRYEDSQWQVLTVLLSVLKLAFAELDVVMRERGEADYVSNAVAARRALGTSDDPTDFAMRLDYRLQHLLVDEFQDTSRGQVELLAQLTAAWTEGDGHTLFCVGDPMQSIYRFRHADVGLFLKLKRDGLNQLRLAPLRLSVNFRASKPVLRWVNETFKAVLPTRDEPERGAVAYTASDARENGAEAGGVFVHATLRGELDKSQARAEEARQIGALISRTLKERDDAKIGVLAANRSHLQAVIRELHVRGIAFQAVELDSLAKRPAIQDLIALTRALVHLGDRTAWLSVLRAPWCGLSLADLHELVSGVATASATVWDCLSSDERMTLLSSDGRQRIERVHRVVERALRTRGRIGLRECVERTWHAIGGPATLATESALEDCRAFFTRLEQVERNGDLEDPARLEDSLLDLYASADTSAASERVELMTIHRAKGLEFDVVILPALDSGAKSDEPPLLRVQELPELGERALLLAPIASRGAEKDSIYAWLEALDKTRARLEQGRLLYVAATRAEHELHLFGAADSDEKGPKKPRAGTFLNLLWPSVESHFANANAPASAQLSAARASAIRIKRLPVEWTAPAPNASFGESPLRDVVENEPLQPEFEWVGETARHIGTLVHRWIERIARAGLGNSPDSSATHSGRSRIELAELGVPPHLLEFAERRVKEALDRMLSDERGRWLLAGTELHKDAASELALSGVVNGEIVNRVIDRTFLAQDGTRWIVDFKTSTHEGGGREEFLNNEVERYRPQLMSYAQLMGGYRPGEKIKAALYFPLLGAWREVPV